MTPDVDRLMPWARRALEQAYAQRPPRESDGSRRASREDFSAGFIAALVWLNSSSSFVHHSEEPLEVTR